MFLNTTAPQQAISRYLVFSSTIEFSKHDESGTICPERDLSNLLMYNCGTRDGPEESAGWPAAVEEARHPGYLSPPMGLSPPGQRKLAGSVEEVLGQGWRRGGRLRPRLRALRRSVELQGVS
jgi:hypothetical protein